MSQKKKGELTPEAKQFLKDNPDYKAKYFNKKTGKWMHGRSPNLAVSRQPFTKGHKKYPKKGNPNLRGKKMKTILNEILDSLPTSRELADFDPRLLAEIEGQIGRKPTRREIMGVSNIYEAMKASAAHTNLVLDRTEGKPVQVNQNENINKSYEDFLAEIAEEEDE